MKKSLLLALCIALCAAISLGGTLAFLSDSEEAVNVMTVGKVDIVLNEYQRGGKDENDDGIGDELVPFENPQNLMPIVGSAQGEKDAKFGLPKAKNYVDKLTTVKNVNRSDAWVRIIVGVPTSLGVTDPNAAEGNLTSSVVHSNMANRFTADGSGKFATAKWDDPADPSPYYTEWMLGGDTYGVKNSWGEVNGGTCTIDGIKYDLQVYTRSTPLAYGEETTAALGGFYLDEHIDYNDETDKWEYVEIKNGTINRTELNFDLDDGIIIPVMAQAVQADGFDTAAQAFAAAFGDVVENGKLTVINPWATLEVGVEQSASTVEELEKAMLTNGTITVENAIDTKSLSIPSNANVTLDLSGNTIANENGLFNNGTAVIENGTVETNYPGSNTSVVYGAVTRAGANTTYNNVDVISNNGGVNVWGTAVWNDGDVTLNSVSTSTRHVFYVAGAEGGEGQLTINGGEFKFNPTNRTRKGYYIAADGANAKVIVNGGIFHEPSTRTGYTAGILENGGEVIIRGGQFKFDPSNWVDTGYQAVKNAEGWWVVSAVNP